MSFSVAARHGAAALPVFSSAARARARVFSAAGHPRRRSRAFTVATRAEMEYDYDIFTIGTRFFAASASVHPPGPPSPATRRAIAPARADPATSSG